MRHYTHFLALLLVLAAPFFARGFLAAQRAPSPESRGNTRELRILTPHAQDIRETFSRAFSIWHQARFRERVQVVYLTPGGTLDIVRYVGDSYASIRDRETGALADEMLARPVAELVWGGGDTTFDRELKPFLKPVSLPEGVLAAAFPTPDLNGIALYESRPEGGAPRWIGIALSSFGILYSPELYATLGLPPPETWSDLTRPELAGLLALADPTRVGSAAIAYVVTVQRAMADAEIDFFKRYPGPDPKRDPRYRAALAKGWKRGMSTLLRIAANARYFTGSASQTPNDVGNGEAAAGIAIDFYARVFQERLGEHRLKYVAPPAATALTADPVGVLYGTLGDAELLANRFIEFLLTPEAQRLWILKPDQSPVVERALRRLPIRRDVYRDRRGFTDDLNPFHDSGGFNLRPEWMGAFRELRLIWAAAFIDSKSSLDRAYRRILSIGDRERREALLERLADLPIDLGELSELSAEHRALSERPTRNQDPRLFLARARVKLADRFRRHYRSVASQASERRASDG